MRHFPPGSGILVGPNLSSQPRRAFATRLLPICSSLRRPDAFRSNVLNKETASVVALVMLVASSNRSQCCIYAYLSSYVKMHGKALVTAHVHIHSAMGRSQNPRESSHQHIFSYPPLSQPFLSTTRSESLVSDIPYRLIYSIGCRALRTCHVKT